jgi:hypothetical protein
MRLAAHILIAFCLVVGVSAVAVQADTQAQKDKDKKKKKVKPAPKKDPKPKTEPMRKTDPKPKTEPMRKTGPKPKENTQTFVGEVVRVYGPGPSGSIIIKHANGTGKSFTLTSATKVGGIPGVHSLAHMVKGQLVTVTFVGKTALGVHVTRQAPPTKVIVAKHKFTGKVTERNSDAFGDNGHVSVQNGDGTTKKFRVSNGTYIDYKFANGKKAVHTLQGVARGQTAEVHYAGQDAARIHILFTNPHKSQPFNAAGFKGWVLRGSASESHWVRGHAKMDPNNHAALSVSRPRPATKGRPAAHEFVNTGAGIDLYTEREYGDVNVHLDFMIPRHSDSGVYLMGKYEVQILDQAGRTAALGPRDVGSIYNETAPLMNAAKPAGQWQHLVVHFQAPRFNADGVKVANAKFLKVILNGKVIQENVEAYTPTGGALDRTEMPTGPLLLQGDCGAVAYRHIKITPAKAK